MARRRFQPPQKGFVSLGLTPGKIRTYPKAHEKPGDVHHISCVAICANAQMNHKALLKSKWTSGQQSFSSPVKNTNIYDLFPSFTENGVNPHMQGQSITCSPKKKTQPEK